MIILLLQAFFIDHTRRRTTSIDPRLPTTMAPLQPAAQRARSATPAVGDDGAADVDDEEHEAAIEVSDTKFKFIRMQAVINAGSHVLS